MNLVKITHPKAGESMVPASAVPAWRASGWEVAATAAAEPQDEAPAAVRQAAEKIGAALARHGVVATPTATIAAAYDVLATQDGATDAEQDQEPAPAGDPPESGGEPAEPGDEPTQHEAKPERRTRRQSSKGDE